MKTLRTVFVALVAFFLPLVAFAHGKNDVTERSVNQDESWRELFDLNDKKEGKYNIMVTAEDNGGNVTVGGPFNIWVDPESDLPVAGITNPQKNMRVPGNLNIVGTCVDDDAVRMVELVLDRDYDHPKLAEGKEFWSYYLDTTQMEEGQHTIEVYGTDVNGLRGHSTTVTWNLDRRQPETSVTNYTLGALVSGKINLKGTVSDGNGIKSLFYSLDNGQTFKEVKLHLDKETGICSFDAPVDTRLSKDGPSVCWFKAYDKMGSAGIYSFLYFVDNTNPDVRIITPKAGDVCNGTFGVAGYAKDVIGIKELSWSFAGESGSFELIPGNPYWYKEVNTTDLKKKSEVFTITATDIAGNTVVVRQEIPLNQENDKPVVTIAYPVEGEAYDCFSGTLFARGIVYDDDGLITSVDYSLDGAEPVHLEAQGVFYMPLSLEQSLAAGKHTLTVSAEDKYGVRGNPVTVTFVSKGEAPVFAEAQLRLPEETLAATPGIRVNPEAKAFVETEITCPAGIKQVTSRAEWGTNGRLEKEIFTAEKKTVSTYAVSIPVGELPWGLVRLTVSATDIYDRTTEQTTVLRVDDLTKLITDTPAVIFDDSTVSETGVVISDTSRPLTGYFAGGKVQSAALVPATPFATLSADGNYLTVTMTDKVGVSEPVHVHVVTDQNIGYDSRDLIFQSAAPAPVVTVDGALESASSPLDGSGPVHISGSVSSQVPVHGVSYRILSAEAAMLDGLFTGKTEVKAGEFKELTLTDNRFSLELSAEDFAEGTHAVEIVADNGKKASAVAFVRKLPALPEPEEGKKAVNPANPVFTWFTDSVDIYWVCTYQGSASVYGGVISRESLPVGTSSVEAKTEARERTFTGSVSVERPASTKVYISAVDEKPFHNGMEVIVPYGVVKSVQPPHVTARIESDVPVQSLVYAISGEKVAGGDVEQTGKVPVRLVEENVYEADVPLQNIPARRTTILLTAETKAGKAEYRGSVVVLREHDAELIDNERAVYWLPQENAQFSEELAAYVVKAGTAFVAYGNMPGPVTAEFATAQPGLIVSVSGNTVVVTGEKQGLYTNVALRVKDSQGADYVSPKVNLLVDTDAPQVSIQQPQMHQWVHESFDMTVGATDDNGVVSVEYSIDDGATWLPIKAGASGYSAKVALDEREDGLVPVDVRAFDKAGRVQYAHTAVQKDTTPPEVTVILPSSEDIVNGENLLVFMAKDNAGVSRAEYVAPPAAGGKTPAPQALEMAPLMHTMIGTPEMPINDLMSVNVYDEAGNVTQVRAWDFIIDQQSDLPIAEVHLPEENAVITRDFTVSGVVLDDDGASKIWYKVDNGEYKALPDYDNSFAIDMALLDFTDNEHSVTIYAEDIHGVKGPEYVRNFRISLEEPKGAVRTPPITETVKRTVTLKGTASDKNGIAAVYVSVDNGNSYNEARGVFGHDKIDTEWDYTFDTRVVQDGTHVVFLKIVDWYGIEGLFSSLITIDNTAPEIKLELPLDGSKSTGMVFFSGQTLDNVKLEKLFITMHSLDGKTVSKELSRTDLIPGDIISQALDMSSLPDGFYNIELVGMDAAENATRVSRNIQLDKTAPKATVDLLYPLNGEAVRGIFNIYGTAVSETSVEKLTLFIDGEAVSETELSFSGYYKFRLTPEMIADGQHEVEVRASLENGQSIASNRQYLNYTSMGPWVTIDNFTYGDFAIDRPYLRGDAGYAIAEEDLIAAKSKGVDSEFKASVMAKAVDKVELSLDNGKTWELVSDNGKWRYRVENKDIEEGYHFLLLRATMKNGETAVTRTIVQVDSTAPTVRLISPGSGGRYNQELLFSGLTHDDVALKDVKLYLRKGDKSAYELPTFIQGLYFDWQFWGATFYSIGAGLTFFDDNVKLQVQWGQFTKSQWQMFQTGEYRYGGNSIVGAKLLANVYYLPFRYLFGPDWEWLSMNVALGANFTHFSDSGSGSAQTLSAALFQLEFPRITFDKQKMFRTIALYTEGQLWFIPSDVSSDDIPTMVPQVSVGLRVNVF
ncbi:MAG: hypothetical protein K6G80_04335 [Treponema sp.]|nr:hypothetical protein [Treponema sp.]